jgi:hypothetical protein
MQNVSGTFACFMCGTVDEAQRALAVSSSSGSSRSSSGTNSSGMTPALLEQLARDAHFSLTTHLTELVHRLALISAQAEAGMGRVTQDPAYIRVLINIMKSYCAQPAAAGSSQETPLLACRGLNYYLSLGASYTAEVREPSYDVVYSAVVALLVATAMSNHLYWLLRASLHCSTHTASVTVPLRCDATRCVPMVTQSVCSVA